MDAPKRTKFCSNCKRHISEDVFLTHELHCKRRIVLCKVCEEPIPRTEIEEHNKTEHGPVPCDLCGTEIPKHELENHKEICPKVKTECKYCELDITRDEYTDHTESCGSRTDFCELCNQRVMLRNMQEHLENKCAPIGAEDFRSNNGTPPPTYAMHEQASMHVDPQWLASVSGACGNDDLNQVLAQNIRAMEGHSTGGGGGAFRRLMSQSSSEDDSEFSRDDYGGAHAVLDYAMANPRGLSKEELDKLETERRDAELAMRIHERENVYRPTHAGNERREDVTASYESQDPGLVPPVQGQDARSTVTGSTSGSHGDRTLKREDSGGLSTDESDADIAKMIHERDLEYAGRKTGSGDQGHPGWVDVMHWQGNQVESSRPRQDTIEADRRNKDNLSEGNDRSRSPFALRKADRRNSDIDAQLAREIAQREDEYVKGLEADRQLAEQIQQFEDRKKNGQLERESGASLAGHVDATERPRFKVLEADRKVAERMQASEQHRHKREGDDLEVAHRLLSDDTSSRHLPGPHGGGAYSYNRDVLMNEEPRPKTPVPQLEDEGQVPCQYCSELFPFKMIMQHQEVCLNEGQSRSKMSADFFSSIKQHREQEDDVMLTDETLQQISHEDSPHLYDHWGSQIRKCKFCDEEMMLGRLQTHEVVCDKNPDTLLRNVRKESPPLRPPSPEHHHEAIDEGPVNLNSAGPCEYCKKLFPVASLVKHEDVCHYRTSSSSSRSHPPVGISPHTQVRDMPPVHRSDNMDIGTTSPSRARPGLAIRFPGQSTPSLNPSYPQSSLPHGLSASLSSSTDSSQLHHKPQSSFPGKPSSKPPAYSGLPSATTERRYHQPRVHTRDEEVVHGVKQRSDPPLAVVGKSISKPDFPGREGWHNRYSGGDPVKKPLETDASALFRRSLHSDPSVHNGRNSFI